MAVVAQRTAAPRTICLLGLGEVGTVLAEDLASAGPVTLTAWDRLFIDPASTPSQQLAALRHVRAAEGAATAAQNCALVISAVTAAGCIAAVESILPALLPGAWFLDLNSVAPATKRAAAARVEAAGGRFVEGAIMAPIAPDRLQSPLLVGGPHAEEFAGFAKTLGFSGLRFCSTELGRAAATKLCRSVVVKGLEALLAEALLAARHYGVEEAVLDSLANLVPDNDWRSHAPHMLNRSLRHGRRRAEEMREAAATVAEANIEALMSEACARRQDWAADLELAAGAGELPTILDSILAIVAKPQTGLTNTRREMGHA